MPTPYDMLSSYLLTNAQDPRIAAALAKSGIAPPLTAPVPGFGAPINANATPGAIGQNIQNLLAGTGQGVGPGVPGLPNITMPAGGGYGAQLPIGSPLGGGRYPPQYGMQGGMGKGSGPLTPGLQTPWGAERLPGGGGNQPLPGFGGGGYGGPYGMQGGMGKGSGPLVPGQMQDWGAARL